MPITVLIVVGLFLALDGVILFFATAHKRIGTALFVAGLVLAMGLAVVWALSPRTM